VQPPTRVADLVDQPGLDVHVNVLERRFPRQLTTLQPCRHAPEPADDRGGVLGADQPLGGEHLGMGDRPCHIMRQQPAIEADRCVQRRRCGVKRPFESPASRTFRSRHGAQYKRHMTNTQRVTFPSSAGEASGVLVTPPAQPSRPAS